MTSTKRVIVKQKPRFEMPPGVNTVNMGEDGKRHCFLYEYGTLKHPDGESVIAEVCRAWGVVDRFDIDVYVNKKRNSCTRDYQRHFMLKFADGLWRHASFGGISGEPMASCDWDGYPGQTGEVGYLTYKVHWQTRNVTAVMEKLEEERAKLATLQTALESAKAK